MNTNSTNIEDGSYHKSFLESLRQELVSYARDYLSPVATKYGAISEPLDTKVGWRPTVLVLGNYSSGKSTLINELTGQNIQRTGQAPTDDSFTVLTHSDDVGVEERDGFSLVDSDQMPFQSLKKYGSKFRSHFRMKAFNAPILKDICIIDTPGMVDSVTEQDRGYDYQKVIGELAGISDLILLLFDPHKAGTIRETYESLKVTLPSVTSEDRVVFVMNRVDECSNLNDLLRVYGTLCWNLSQMTGRKDIPHVYLTWAESEVAKDKQPEFLGVLKNQRRELKDEILKAPKAKLHHLVSFLDQHTLVLLEVLGGFQDFLAGKKKSVLTGFGYSLAVFVPLLTLGLFGAFNLLPSDLLASPLSLGLFAVIALVVYVLIFQMTLGLAFSSFRNSWHERLAEGPRVGSSPLEQELFWGAKPCIEKYLSQNNYTIKSSHVKAELRRLKTFQNKELKDAKAALDSQPSY